MATVLTNKRLATIEAFLDRDRHLRFRRLFYQSDDGRRAHFGSCHRVSLLLVCFWWCACFAIPADAETVTFPDPNPSESISIEAGAMSRWNEGIYEVLWLRKGCEIRQGRRVIGGSEAVIWLVNADPFSLTPNKLITFVDSPIISESSNSADGTVVPPKVMLKGNSWLGQLYSHRPIEYGSARPLPQQPEQLPDIYRRAMAARCPPIDTESIPSPTHDNGSSVQLAQFTEHAGVPSAAGTIPSPPLPSEIAPSPRRKIGLYPRGKTKLHFDSFVTPDGSERITIVDSGVNMILEGVSEQGTIDISTDRVVIWSPAGGSGLSLEGGDGGSAKEFYMEGNIVFRQADRVIYATSMYYNVSQRTGTVLNAELLTSLPNFTGVVRLKADVLQQVDEGKFEAHQAAVTSSRMGVPKYWLQSADLVFESEQVPAIDPVTRLPMIDPVTGQTLLQSNRKAAASNNVIYLGEIPVFYWPTVRTDFTRPTNYVNRIRIKSDRVFGTQLGVGIDLKQLTGWGADHPGVDWSGSVDWLSDRGVGFGTTVDYVLPEVFHFPGEARGFLDAWVINEQGKDNLGADRRALVPEEDTRGRVLWQHRQRLLNGLQITGEVGFISDRNFLEQYYENEWDEWKDQTTGLELKYLTETASWNFSGDARLNDFFTQTESIRFDYFELGRSLFWDRTTWLGHSHVGYADLDIASTPEDPVDAAKFALLPWEVDREGLRSGARHELDLPLKLGAMKVVPYALGEVMYWGKVIDGDENTRMYGQAGVRASLPMWSVNPNRQSALFNMNGLAHKVVWESEFLWADASDNFDEFPLFAPLDDDAQEHFRRRFAFDNFGGLTPLKFDERVYALRSGMQSWVTAPSAEIVDDLMLLRGGVRQRWQTKRGLAGRQRVIDWMTLDAEGTWFPKASRDNFGEDFGMFNYDWRWHVGDRLTLMSDGYVDTFGDGLRMFTVGSYISRPERGSAFVGFRSIEGPISSNLLTTAFNYRMSQKWIASASSTIDFGPAGNIGQTLEMTRIGESFLVSVGVNRDESRDNLGVGFFVEPRFAPFSYRSRLGGVAIPPVGAYGLE